MLDKINIYTVTGNDVFNDQPIAKRDQMNVILYNLQVVTN